jgi:hypothetical protein
MAQTNAQFAGFDEFIAGKEKAENLNKAAQASAASTTNDLTGANLDFLNELVNNTPDAAKERVKERVKERAADERHVLSDNPIQNKVIGYSIINTGLKAGVSFNEAQDLYINYATVNEVALPTNKALIEHRQKCNALTYFGENHLANAA